MYMYQRKTLRQNPITAIIACGLVGLLTTIGVGGLKVLKYSLIISLVVAIGAVLVSWCIKQPILIALYFAVFMIMIQKDK